MRILAGVLFEALLMFGSPVWGQAAPASTPILPIRPRLDTVYSAAAQTDPMPELEQFCEGIGPRLTGSVAAQRSERQVLAHMRKIGLQKAHSESWTLPRAWQRGSAKASLIAPFAMPIPISAYGWTGSTGGSIGVDVRARRRRVISVSIAARISCLSMLMNIPNRDSSRSTLWTGSTDSAHDYLCSTDYIQTLGITMRKGRFFSQDDVESARHVVVINMAFAQQ